MPIVVSSIISVLGGLVGTTASAAASVGVLAVSISLVSYMILGVSKFLLWVAAVVFNWSIENLVFGFSQVLGNSEGMLLAWSMLRDLGNILLIFGFVSIGIQMILNTAHSSAGKTLPRLILFAVLINFSLFAAEAVVDTTNGLTYAFYNQSVEEACEGGTDKECRLNVGVAGQILNQLNIISVVWSYGEIDLGKDIASYFSNPVGSTANFIMLSILVTTAAVTLFAGAMLLISRGVTLAFLLVTSPIGFAGMAIPALNDMSTRWWKTLINNSLFAPVFLILLFVGLRLTDGLRASISGEHGLQDALTDGSALNAGPLFLYVLVIGFMIAALTVAHRFSIIGAEFAISTATKVGTAPFLYPRDMVGRRFERMAKSYDRGVARVASVLPKGLHGILGDVAKPLRSGLEAGQKITVPGYKGSYASDKEKREAYTKAFKHTQHEEHLEHEIEDALVEAKNGKPGKLNALASKMSMGDWKHTAQFEKGSEGIREIAKALPPNKFKAAMDDKDIPSETKDVMRGARFEGYDTTVHDAANGSPTATTAFEKMSGTNIGMSGLVADPVQRRNIAVMASDAQFDDILKTDITDDDKNELREIRNGTGTGDRFDTTAPIGGISNAERTIGKMSSSKIAELPSKILEQPAVLRLLDVEDFLAIAKAERLGKSAKQAAKTGLDLIRTNPAHPKYRRYRVFHANLSIEQRGTFDAYYS